MMNKTVKIANFSEMLATLTEKSRYGFKDIHTLQVSKTFKYNACQLFDGILYDGQDEDKRVVKYAQLAPGGQIHIQKYFGNTKDNPEKELDSIIKVKTRFICDDAPYIVVEVTGNGGGLYSYTIADGNCMLNLGLTKRITYA